MTTDKGTPDPAWARITATPGYKAQVQMVLRHIRALSADRADNREAYLTFANRMKRWPITLTPDPAGGSTVTFSWPGTNDHMVTMASFEPGAKIEAVSLIDLQELDRKAADPDAIPVEIAEGGLSADAKRVRAAVALVTLMMMRGEQDEPVPQRVNVLAGELRDLFGSTLTPEMMPGVVTLLSMITLAVGDAARAANRPADKTWRILANVMLGRFPQ